MIGYDEAFQYICHFDCRRCFVNFLLLSVAAAEPSGFCPPQSEEFYFQVDRVDVVLIDPEVTFCDLDGGVIEDLHDDRQRGV